MIAMLMEEPTMKRCGNSHADKRRQLSGKQLLLWLNGDDPSADSVDENGYGVTAEDDRFTPTSASPGSAEKIDVLRFRMSNGLPLWHKNDFSWSGTEGESE